MLSREDLGYTLNNVVDHGTVDDADYHAIMANDADLRDLLRQREEEFERLEAWMKSFRNEMNRCLDKLAKVSGLPRNEVGYENGLDHISQQLATLTQERDAFQSGQLEIARALGYQEGEQLTQQSFILQQLAAAQDRCTQLETAIEKAASAPGYNWLHEQLELAKALTPTDRPPA